MNIFETPRLVIRQLKLNDSEQLSAITADEQAMQYSASGAIDTSKNMAFITDCFASYKATGFGYWGIENKDTKALIGLCGLNRHKIDNADFLHLNYRLATAFLGKGYATEAANGLKKYCFDQLNESALYAIIEPQNIDSIQVAKRCGFKFEFTTEFNSLTVNIYRASTN